MLLSKQPSVNISGAVGKLRTTKRRTGGEWRGQIRITGDIEERPREKVKLLLLGR